jgi:8-oxo-dGTP pyrophosphatase MutT (NUDIX family)
MIHAGNAVTCGADVVAAGVILRRRTAQGDRWLLLKARKHREWGFPKGHQDHGERLEETALRECAEECGIGLMAFDGTPLELHYRLPSGRTKKVVYFPAVTATVLTTLSDEHVDAAWFSASAVVDKLPYDNLRTLFQAYLARLPRC